MYWMVPSMNFSAHPLAGGMHVAMYCANVLCLVYVQCLRTPAWCTPTHHMHFAGAYVRWHDASTHA